MPEPDARLSGPLMQVRCISLWQPWAQLIALGVKKYETRSWPASYRGLLAIHAAQKWDSMLAGTCKTFHIEPPERGGIVCLTRMVDCQLTQKVFPSISPEEHAAGNWDVGRFCWKLEVLQVYTPIIKCNGQQGFWSVDVPAWQPAGGGI